MLKTFFLNSDLANYGEEEFNYIQKFLLQQGILNTQGADYNDFIDLKVLQNGAGDMTVNVGIGTAVLSTTRNSVNFKVFISNLASASLPITNNTTGANRVDAVILKLSRVTEPDALMSNVATLQVVAGSGVVALADNAIQTAIGADYDFIRLADLTVSNGDTQILTADIADTRVRCYTTDTTVPNPTIIKFRQLTADPSVPLEGEMWYNTTANILRYYDGATTINIQASVYTGGNGIDITAGVVSVKTVANGAIKLNSDSAITYGAPFGDGSDGDVTISGNTNLARDMYYNNLTINTGIILNPYGYRIFVKGILNCVGTGKIASNGGDGGNGTNGSGATSGTAGAQGTIAYPAGGTLPVGYAGGGSGNAVKSLIPLSTAGATGGNSGSSQSDVYMAPVAGGVGGTVTSNPITRPYSIGSYYNLYDFISGVFTLYGNAPQSGAGATGQNSGWGGGMGGAGGGGGAGATGGFIWISAYSITNLNVEAKGGNGGNGGNGTSSAHSGGAGGGGGGGNGGTILVFFSKKVTITSSVAGGTGGTAGGVGPAGTNGGNGNAGLYKEIQF